MQDLRLLDRRYRIILCDLWGCVHNGVSPFDGTLDLLRTWRDQGRWILFITNAPRPVESVRVQLDNLGIGSDCYDAITSSGDAALAYIAREHGGEDFGFIGQQKDRVALTIEGLTLSDEIVADSVICCGFAEDHIDDLDHYRAPLAKMSERGSKLLCFNPDIFVVRDGVKELCAGAIARLYQEMGGTALYFGKPERPIYDRALQLAKASGISLESRDEVLVIGDNVATDLAGAVRNGFHFLFVSNGVEADAIAAHGRGWLKKHLADPDAHPDFYLTGIVERLAWNHAGKGY